MRAVALVAATCILPGCNRSQGDSVKAAQQAMDAKDTPSALIHLKNAVAANPNDGEARFLLAQQLMAMGEADAAVAEFRRARELKLPDERVVPELARALFDAGQSKLLIEQFGTAQLPSGTANARLQAQLASAYLNMGSVPRARQAANQALAADSNLPESRLASARVSLRESGRDAAMKEVDELLKLAPGFGLGWAFKGNLLAMDGDQSQAALGAFAKALELDPRQFQALFSTAAMHLTLGDLTKAKEGLAKLKQYWPRSVFAGFLEAQLLSLEGKHTEARLLFASLRNSLPTDAVFSLASGLNELKLGAYVQAEAQLGQAVSLDPKNLPARYYLAQAQMQQGRPDRASQSLAPMLEGANVPVEVLLLAAQARLYQGDAKGANELNARAERMGTQSPSVKAALAMIRVANGDVEPAMRELKLVSDTSPDVDADLKIVSTRLARGEADAALAAIDRLESKRPSQASTHELRGQALLLKGDFDAARRSFDAALAKDKFYFPAIAQLTNLDARAGRLADADKRITDLLKLNPSDSRLLTLLALTKVRSGGSSQEVLSLLERATKEDPRDLEAWLALIMRHFQAGDLQTALAAGQSAVAMIPDNVKLLDLIGRIQLQAGDARLAASTFANLINSAPHSPAGYVGQAAALVATGELNAANQVMRRLLERQPDYVDGLRLMADIAVRRGKHDEAIAIARDIQRRHPDSAAGFRLEGIVELARLRQPAAVAAFRKGLDKADAADIPVRLYGALQKGPAPAEAEAFAATWLQQHPKDTGLMNFRAFVQARAGSMAAARQTYEQVLAIDPENVESLNNLSLLMLQMGDPPQKALDMAQRALKLRPNQPDVLDTVAQIQVAQKQFGPAVETLKIAINRATNPAPLRLALARVYLGMNDRDRAAAELDTLVALGKTSATYREARRLQSQLSRRE